MSEKRAYSNEQGMVSFLVTMIMLIVITLIVVGFSQVIRRNSRETLDRQLSSQAFYAAESGVNVTAAAIKSYVTTNGFASLSTKTSCSHDYDPSVAGGVGAAISSLGTTAAYTCVLVNPNPSAIVRDVSQTDSAVVPILAASNLNQLQFTWNVQSGGIDTSCVGANAYSFPASSAWTCDFGVLRVDLTANPSGNIANLINNTVTLYLTPLGGHAGTMTVTSFASPDAYVGSASGCSTGTCSVKVNLPVITGSYYARITSIYRDASNTTITGTLASGGAANFSGAQAVVDVTGQSQDELRRIQVRVALTRTPDASSIPPTALTSSNDICKRFPITQSDNVDPTNLCQ
ncbi:MAG TPA: pilus assembly PilX N-terminal domain-containing protein [Candidatus Saccharimonadales bacterium]|nr:pilus assembly PilX N-terminal domain-containing protein [Candidatus Saccharimonadales bacterium]